MSIHFFKNSYRKTPEEEAKNIKEINENKDGVYVCVRDDKVFDTNIFLKKLKVSPLSRQTSWLVAAVASA